MYNGPLSIYRAWASTNRPSETEAMDRMIEDEALCGMLPTTALVSGAMSDRSARSNPTRLPVCLDTLVSGAMSDRSARRLAQAVEDGRLGR